MSQNPQNPKHVYWKRRWRCWEGGRVWVLTSTFCQSTQVKKKNELKAKEEETSQEFFRKSFVSIGSSSLARMALALGSRRLGNGHLGSLALGSRHLAQATWQRAHNSGLDESSWSGNLLGTDNAVDTFTGNCQKIFLFLSEETFLLLTEALQLMISSQSVLHLSSSEPKRKH